MALCRFRKGVTEMDYYAYAGKILRVDLTSGKTKKVHLESKLINEFLGGWGINYKLAWELIRPDIEPLAYDAPIIIGLGPLVGTMVPGAAKMFGTYKAPIRASEDGRHYVATATCGSHRFAVFMKSAGYDHMVITGRASGPVYLKIIDDDVEICDANDLWGKRDIYETQDELVNRYGEVGVISIGAAGEFGVRWAMAVVDKSSHFGRDGLGAVMGSKNLKAIVVKGTKGIRVAHAKALLKGIGELQTKIRSMPYLQRLHDDAFHAGFNLIIQPNMNPGVWSRTEWDNLYGPEKWKEIRKGVKACTGCLLSCKPMMQIRQGKLAGVETYTGHYLNVGTIGQRLGIRDQHEALKLYDVMNRAGMCFYNVSGLLEWVTDLFHRGVITEKHTQGIKLTKSFDSYLRVLNMIINRDGFGRILGEGWYDTSEWAGVDAREDHFWANGISKGVDGIYPARKTKLDPMRFTMGITNPRGGISQQGHSYTTTPLMPLNGIIRDAESWGTPRDAIERIFTPTDYYGQFNVGRLTKHVEDYYSIANSLGSCTIYSMYILTNTHLLAEFYSAATGIEVSVKELKRFGEKNYNLYKMLNVREGFSKKDDKFPEIWLKPLPTPDGPEYLTDYYRIHRISKDDIERLLNDYYDERGWDIEKGVPTKEKLVELGLQDFVL